MKKKFNVEGMSCAACQAHVQKAVEKLEGTRKVNVNLLQNTMDVEFDESVCSAELIESAVSGAGYRAYLPETTDKNSGTAANKKDGDKALKNLIISAAFLIVLMYFSMGNMMWGWWAPAIFDHHENPMGFALLQFILVLPIIFIYRNYFVSGFKKLFKGKPNMDSLIAIGGAASLLYSVFSMFMISIGHTEYHDTLYFEAAGMILTLVSLGKYLEGLSKRRTTDAITKLMDLAPKRAVVLRGEKEMEVAVEEVRVGDVVIVKQGASVPVDGEIIDGSASFDQSNITGESMPVFKKIGERVFSSTLVTAGYVKVKATEVGENTSIANVIRLVEEASSSKAPISKAADKISGVFVPVIFGIAVITFIVNLLVQRFSVGAEWNGAFELAFRFAITVVVIACPCALGLATPVAIMVGTGKGAENGLLIRNAEILEKAHLIKTVVLDKTGTITEGRPKVTDFCVFGSQSEDELLSHLYSLENRSEHPLAQAVAEFAKERKAVLLQPDEYRSVEGRGIEGKIGNDEYRIGNVKILDDLKLVESEIREKAEQFSKEGKTPLLVVKNGRAAGIIAVKDRVKEGSKQAIKELKKRGIKVVMLTGDNRATAEKIAEEVGVDEVISDVFPADKQRIVEGLKTDDKHLVAMVGDGVNDAPALTGADLGIAMGGGSDIAIESGDIVLLRKNLTDVINVIDLSKRVLRTIKLGLFWAFFYNLVCVVIAAGTFYYIPGVNFGLKPEYGSIAMSVSSVSVVLNALTINLFKVKKTEENYDETSTVDGTVKFTVSVQGMMCGHCETRVRDAVLKVSGVKSAVASYERKTVEITANENVKREEIVKNIAEAGYKAKL